MTIAPATISSQLAHPSRSGTRLRRGARFLRPDREIARATGPILTLLLSLGPATPGLAQSGSNSGWDTIYWLHGEKPYARFGYGLAGGEDLDADGYHDLVIGADGYSSEAGNAAGAVYLVSGRYGEVVLLGTGPRHGARLGHAVAFAGDVDADGTCDVIGGAPFFGFPDLDFTGACMVWSGATGDVLYHFFGTLPYDQLGHGVSGLDDIDGDGYDDFVIGSPWAKAGQLSVGSVSVHSGYNGSVLWRVDGTVPASGLGYRVMDGGDFDGDGIDDVIAGAHGGSPRFRFADHGEVVVLSGVDGNEILRLSDTYSTSEIHDQFGFSIGAPGDVDGRGVPDVLVGAPYADPGGRTNAGAARLFAGEDGALLDEWHGDEPHDLFGRAVAGPGDMNGDGVPDLAVGSGNLPPFPRSSGSQGHQMGDCFIFDGATSNLLYRVELLASCDGAGQYLAPAGDVDGDGRADLLSGAPYHTGSSCLKDGYEGRVHVVGYRP